MKIIELIYSLSSGGGERFVVDLSNELAKRGNDVTICMLLDDTDSHLSFNRQFIADNVKFHAMGFSSGFSLFKVKRIEDYILSEQPDVVHCHLNVIPYIFRLAYSYRNIHFFHTLHSIASKASGSKYQYIANKYFYSHGLIKPITISKQCLESYINLYKQKDVVYVNNGCATVRPTLHIGSVREEILDLKRGKDIPVFIHVARCSKEKNQELLIESFNNLNAEKIEFILMIIGNGYDSDLGERLKKQACNKIFFLGEKNNVGDYLLCSDAFCLTSFYEGLPISLLEALSCGVTPICTAVGGIPDVITDSKTGYLAETSIESYLNAVKCFINKKLSKDYLIDYFNKNFSMTVCAEKYERLFNSLK